MSIDIGNYRLSIDRSRDAGPRSDGASEVHASYRSGRSFVAMETGSLRACVRDGVSFVDVSMPAGIARHQTNLPGPTTNEVRSVPTDGPTDRPDGQDAAWHGSDQRPSASVLRRPDACVRASPRVGFVVEPTQPLPHHPAPPARPVAILIDVHRFRFAACASFGSVRFVRAGSVCCCRASDKSISLCHPTSTTPLPGLHELWFPPFPCLSIHI